MLIRIVRLPFGPRSSIGFSSAISAVGNPYPQQPGCRHLKLWQDADQPHIYCIYSHRDDAAALAAYRHSALFGEVWPATKQLLAAPAEAFSVLRAA